MRIFTAVAFALVASGPVLQGQRSLRPGTVVEVAGVRGEAVASSASSLTLRTRRGLDSVPMAPLTDWRWRGTHAAMGAGAGAVTGTVLLGLFGIAISGMCEVDCGTAARDGAIIGGALGAVSGAAAGAVLGSLVPKWHEERGTTAVVRESDLARLPVKAHLVVGATGDAQITQGGVQLVRGDYRVGVEYAQVGLGMSSSYVYYGEPFDPRLQIATDVSREGRQLGLAVERRIAGPLWAVASALHRTSTERTRSIDLGTWLSPGGAVITTSTRDESGLGGSVGLVARHRVIGDVWLRVDARQHFRPNSVRSLAAGVEL